MMWFRKAEEVLVRHVREPRLTEEQVERALAGQGKTPTLEAVREIAERMVWTYVQQARGGDPQAVARLDAVMEFEALLEEYAGRKVRA